MLVLRIKDGQTLHSLPRLCGRPIKGSKYDASWVDEIEAIDAVFDD